jgi:homoserine dehydrogenase
MVAPLKVGVAGLGTVGTSVVRLIERQREALEARCGRSIEIVAVSARSPSKQRDIEVGNRRWVADPIALARDGEIDVFVELIGGDGDPARSAVEAALAAGKSVITANKALLARHGVALAALAEKQHVALNFEAAVAGGIPIVKTLREGLVGNKLARIYGILNGTCNYILTRMEEEKLSFAECLKDAQRLGYAEADPSFDVDGHDTAQKLAILASLAFGTKVDPDAVYVEGISSITPADLAAADELGYRIKLLGVALRTDSGIEQRVHPTMVPKDTAIAEVDGVLNCVAIDGDFVGDVTLVGPGAGGGPTASSVTSDLIDIARGHILPPFGTKAKSLKPYKRAQMRAHEGGYYIRLSVYDRTGAFAAIAGRMAEQGISIESIVQRRASAELPGLNRRHEGSSANVVMITHQTTEAAIRKALAAIERDGHVDAKPQMIRIEKL